MKIYCYLAVGLAVLVGQFRAVAAEVVGISPAEPAFVHVGLTLRQVAAAPNPTLQMPTPDIVKLQEKIDHLKVYEDCLVFSLKQTLDYLVAYTQVQHDTMTDAEPTLMVCRRVRDAFRYYNAYQQTYHRNGLRKDLKEIMQEVTLLALKQIQWVLERKENSEDDYYRAYYSTLRRYFEVCEGQMFMNGQFIAVQQAK